MCHPPGLPADSRTGCLQSCDSTGCETAPSLPGYLWVLLTVLWWEHWKLPRAPSIPTSEVTVEGSSRPRCAATPSQRQPPHAGADSTAVVACGCAVRRKDAARAPGVQLKPFLCLTFVLSCVHMVMSSGAEESPGRHLPECSACAFCGGRVTCLGPDPHISRTLTTRSPFIHNSVQAHAHSGLWRKSPKSPMPGQSKGALTGVQTGGEVTLSFPARSTAFYFTGSLTSELD